MMCAVNSMFAVSRVENSRRNLDVRQAGGASAKGL